MDHSAGGKSEINLINFVGSIYFRV